jgi:hypothetical protein
MVLLHKHLVQVVGLLQAHLAISQFQQVVEAQVVLLMDYRVVLVVSKLMILQQQFQLVTP